MAENTSVEATILTTKPGELGTAYAAMPKLLFYQVINDKEVTILELLGLSVYALMRYRSTPLQLPLVLRATHDVGKVLQWMHRKGYIHRDVKPDNILLGRGDNCERVYLIDYSEARKYKKPIRAATEQVGNPYFISLNVLKGGIEGPKDDWESLLTSMIYLLQGTLPWMKIVEMDPDRLQVLVIEKKENTSVQSLCMGLPKAFITMFEHVRSLQGVDMPDYKLIFTLLKTLAKRENVDLKKTQSTLLDYQKETSIVSEAVPISSARPSADKTRRTSSVHTLFDTNDPKPLKKRTPSRRHTSAAGRKVTISAEEIPTIRTRNGPKFGEMLQEELRGRRARRKLS